MRNCRHQRGAIAVENLHQHRSIANYSGNMKSCKLSDAITQLTDSGHHCFSLKNKLALTGKEVMSLDRSIFWDNLKAYYTGNPVDLLRKVDEIIETW